MPEPHYPDEAAVRRVRSSGEIKWSGRLIYLSQTLAGELVAIEETQDGQWSVRYYAQTIGSIDRKTFILSRRTSQKM